MSQPIGFGQRAKEFARRNADRLLYGGLAAGVATVTVLSGVGGESPGAAPTPAPTGPSHSAPQDPTHGPGPVTARPTPAQPANPRPGTGDGVDPQGRNYKVLSGDTQSSVAREYCSSVSEIAGLNGFSTEQQLRDGDWIVIPHAPSHSGQVTEMLRAMTGNGSDDVRGLLEAEFPGYTVSRLDSETFGWRLEDGHYNIDMVVRDACISFTSGATGFGGSAELRPTEGEGLNFAGFAQTMREAYADYQAVHERAKGQG